MPQPGCGPPRNSAYASGPCKNGFACAETTRLIIVSGVQFKRLLAALSSTLVQPSYPQHLGPSPLIHAPLGNGPNPPGSRFLQHLSPQETLLSVRFSLNEGSST